MSTCTDLINAINAVTVFQFTDLAPSCAVLSLPTNTLETVQLAGGGNAILAAPSSNVGGRVFKVKVAGRVVSASSAASPSFNGYLYLGSSTSGTSILSTGTSDASNNPSDFSFFMEAVGSWDSTIQKAVGFGRSETIRNTGSSHNQTNSEFTVSVSAYTDLKFIFAAEYDNVSNSPSLTLTQFSFEYV